MATWPSSASSSVESTREVSRTLVKVEHSKSIRLVAIGSAPASMSREATAKALALMLVNLYPPVSETRAQ